MGPDYGRRLVAEFVGTAMLIFFGAGTAVATGGDIIAIALAHGLTIMVVAYAFGRTSGAHINPMVTTVLAITRRFPAVELPGYVGAQLLGGIAGAS
jgi:glycerol uptake facilitator-like aquaporin